MTRSLLPYALFGAAVVAYLVGCVSFLVLTRRLAAGGPSKSAAPS